MTAWVGWFELKLVKQEVAPGFNLVWHDFYG